MADNFGLKIGLEGEKEFKKALGDINQTFKVLGSEMKLVDTQFDKSDKSVEGLTARGTVLNKELEEQKKKVEMLRSALENAATSFGENDRRTQNWQIQLNNAEAALNDLQKEVDENNDALDRAKKGMGDAGDEADDSGDKFETLGNVCKATAAAMAANFAAVSAAAVAAGKALVDMAAEGAAYADTVLTESTVTGIATDKLQEYMYAAELVDVSTETLTKSMAKNIKSMQSAADGSAAYADAYSKLGVSVTDANGNLRDSEEVYWELIDSLGKIENETERDAIAMQVLGKSAQELNPLIEAGAEHMAELGEEARQAGYVMGEDALNAYGAFDDQLQYLSVGATAAKNALGTVLLPVLTDLAGEGVDLLGQFTNGILEANGDIGAMSDVIGEILPEAMALIMEYVPEVLEIAGEIVGALGQAFMDNLPLILDSASQIALSLLSGLISALPQISEGAVQLTLSLVSGILSSLPAILEAAMLMVSTLVSGIGSALPTLIPMAVSAIVTVAEGLISNLEPILSAALQLIVGLADGLLAALPVLIESLPSIIDSIVVFLLDSIPLIIDTGIQLLTSLVSNLDVIVSTVLTAIPVIIENLISAILEAIPEIIDAGVSLLISLVQNLPVIISTVCSAIPTLVSSLSSAILGNIDKIILAGVELLVSLVKNLPTIIIEVCKAAPQIISGLVTALSKGVSQLAEVGVNLVKGLWEGIQSLASWLWDKVSGWISGIWDGICDFFGIASPSKEMGWIGEMLVEGLAGAINDNGKDAVKAAENMSADISDVMHGLAADMEGGIATNLSVNGSLSGVSHGASPSGLSLVLNISNFNNYSGEDIRQLTNEIMVTAGQFAKRKGVVFA